MGRRIFAMATLLHSIYQHGKNQPMITHYIKVALRNLERQKSLAFINILGLSIGLACFSLFLLYAVNEFSFDRFHANGSNIYRMYDWWNFQDRQGIEPASVTPLGPAMKNDLPDVENFVRLKSEEEKLIRIADKIHRMKVSYADPQLLSVFTFPLVTGNPETALMDPHNIILTKTKALQLFGETNVVGRPVEIKSGEQYETFIVGGIAEDIPVNSTIRFDILGSFDYILSSEMGKTSQNNWNMTIGISVFVQLRPGSNLMNDPARLALFREKYFPAEEDDLKKEGLWDVTGNVPTGYGLQPLADVHTNVRIDRWGAVDPKNIWILIFIGVSLLLIACINFIILAIGRSAGRSKEVGVRKIVGSQRKQLVFQFLGESLLLTILSTLAGAGLAEILLPLFNDLAGRSLAFSFDQYPEMFALLAGTVITVGLVAGIYPALILSGFKPVEALKSKVRLAGSNIFTRSLVTFQFAISVGLILATVVILQQLSYLRSKNLGFRKENVVMIPAHDLDTRKAYPLFRQAVQTYPTFIGVTASEIGLGAGEGQMGRAYDFHGKKQGVIEYPVDEHFLSVLGMELIAGRNFNSFITTDTINSVIVNEALVNALNTTPAKALGMELKNAREGQTSRTIIGVIKNFNFESLTTTVRPQLFFYPADFKPSCFFVRIKSGDPRDNLEKLESTWKRTAPDLAFTYNFLDEKFDAFYKSEERWSNIVGWAGNICIFLACLGLFGLTSLSVVKRTKEIGIRKVLGASVVNIVRLLCNDFIRLVLIAIIVASPIAWYAMNHWLQNFAYRIKLTWWMFILTALLAITIALLTVSFQVIKAATVNPVNSLKSE